MFDLVGRHAVPVSAVPDLPAVFTALEVARLYGLPVDRVYELARLGDSCPLPGLRRLGRQVRWITADVLSDLGIDGRRAVELLSP